MRSCTPSGRAQTGKGGRNKPSAPQVPLWICRSSVAHCCPFRIVILLVPSLEREPWSAPAPRDSSSPVSRSVCRPNAPFLRRRGYPIRPFLWPRFGSASKTVANSTHLFRFSRSTPRQQSSTCLPPPVRCSAPPPAILWARLFSPTSTGAIFRSSCATSPIWCATGNSRRRGCFGCERDPVGGAGFGPRCALCWTSRRRACSSSCARCRRRGRAGCPFGHDRTRSRRRWAPKGA